MASNEIGEERTIVIVGDLKQRDNKKGNPLLLINAIRKRYDVKEKGTLRRK